jgi:hypothetical protein
MFMPSLGGRGVGVVYSWYLVLMAQGFLYFLTESLLAFGSFKAAAGGADGAEKDKKGAGFRKQHMQWELCAFVFIVGGYVIMLLHDAKMGQLSSYPNPVVGAQRILCHVTVALFSFQVRIARGREGGGEVVRVGAESGRERAEWGGVVAEWGEPVERSYRGGRADMHTRG